MGFLSKLQSRLELHRLEKRYTTRRKATPTPLATYVDGEYIYQTSPSRSSHSNYQSSQLTSSSSTFAASQQNPNHISTSPTAVSFTATPPPSSAWSTTHNGSGTTRQPSWHSFTPSSLGVSGGSNSSARNSHLTAESSASPAAISRNSRGQSWEPPTQGWGGDGTDAFKADKKEFRFDVERDRRSVGRVE